jgi:5-methylcytosine-specific restriction endonuclease McrA
VRLRVDQPLRVAKGILFGYEPEKQRRWRLILKRDPCSYCPQPGRGRTLDHIDPKAKGGTSRMWNLTGACASCNSAKADTPLLLYLLERVNSGGRVRA